jgi:HEAT repeat protein
MISGLILSSCLFVSVLATAPQQAASQPFRNVEGPTLEARIEASHRQARTDVRSGRYWTAWGFDVKPGISIDVCAQGGNGSMYMNDGFSISRGAPETRNVAIFTLRGVESGEIEKVQVFNLDNPRTYEGYAVYWLGKAPNDESIEVLRKLIESSRTKRASERSIMAIAVHDGKRADDVVEGYARRAPSSDAREQAIMALGIFTTRHAVLADFVRDERESVEVRKHSAMAIGVSPSDSAVSMLRDLYATVTNRQVRHEILTAVAVHGGSEEQAVDFLIGVAEKETDRENKRQAIFWLGQKAGKRSIDYLQSTLNSDSGDVEVQKQAVFAISQRDASEAIPILIKVAKTHPSLEVRKQAIFWMSQAEGEDERVVAFLKELLEK